MRALLALVLIVLSLGVLGLARQDVKITAMTVGQTPVTAYAMPGALGPVVVVAHGFAGSQQMMQGYALPLAQAGYRVYVFEFLGHGRHPVPMSGDVTSPEGTTRLLVDQTHQVIDALADPALPVALLGHSMASDVLVRAAQERANVGPMVLISAFSDQITATSPTRLLLITGAWEAGLRRFARAAVQQITPTATEGMTAQNGAVTRRAVVAPYTEHVAVLHSRAGRQQAVDWLNAAYARQSQGVIWPSGWAIMGLLFGVVLLFRPLAAVLPVSWAAPAPLSAKALSALVLLPAVLTPLIAVPLNPRILPVLVADYLGLHLLIYGALQLALLGYWRRLQPQMNWRAFALLLTGCAVFGLCLDRYAANFTPNAGRLWIIAVLMLGAVPAMLADAIATATLGFWARLAVRLGFLASLGGAVALDFRGLFFLLMIAPVLILFYLVFGTMGRNLAQRAGPWPAGLALGVVLAWALGVSFPLFQP